MGDTLQLEVFQERFNFITKIQSLSVLSVNKYFKGGKKNKNQAKRERGKKKQIINII